LAHFWSLAAVAVLGGWGFAPWLLSFRFKPCCVVAGFGGRRLRRFGFTFHLGTLGSFTCFGGFPFWFGGLVVWLAGFASWPAGFVAWFRGSASCLGGFLCWLGGFVSWFGSFVLFSFFKGVQGKERFDGHP